MVKLLEQILSEKENKTIIFTETKRRADELTRGMRRAGWPAMVIHGDKSQQERDWVLKGTYRLSSTLCTCPEIGDNNTTLYLHKSKCTSVFLFAEFRSGKAPIMVATDVAARGIGRATRCVLTMGFSCHKENG